MATKKFNIFEKPGQVNQLLNTASLEMGGRGKKITFLPLELLEPLPCNEDVYSVANLDALAKDIAEVGVRQPLIVFKNKDENYSILAGNRRFAACHYAIEKYHTELPSIPCIIQPEPETDEALRKRMIKDNLQREKTGYERMRELVVYREALEAEWARTPDIPHPDLRVTLMEELDASQSEITRYFKISKSLIPELMDKFAENSVDEAAILPTYVAHRLAKEEPVIQEYVRDTYDWAEPLTDTRLTSLLAAYYSMQETASAEPPAVENENEDSPLPTEPPAKPAPALPEKKQYHFESVHDGTAHLAKVCSTLQDTISPQEELDPRVEKRYIKRIEAEIMKVEALIEEMQLYKSRMSHEQS